MATVIKKAGPKPLPKPMPKPVQSIAKNAPKEYGVGGGEVDDEATDHVADPDTQVGEVQDWEEPNAAAVEEPTPEPAPAAKSKSKVVAKQGKAQVTEEYKDGSMVETSEEVGEVVTGESLASVEVSIGTTKNLGNFESVKFHVTLTLPCAVDVDEINATYENAKEWVDEKVNAFLEEVNDQLT